MAATVDQGRPALDSVESPGHLTTGAATVPERPYVLLSCAISADGCLDGAGPQRLVLSGDADLDRVDAERARSDAIMVGAATVRRDNPRLLVRSPRRQAERAARGLPLQPLRVTVTASGRLDRSAEFFSGPRQPLVYCPAPIAGVLRHRLNGCAEVTGLGPPVSLRAVLADLARRQVGRLMVEAGAGLGREFLAAGLADRLDLAVAPVFVGDPAAPRFAGPARYPHGPAAPMRLAEARRVGEVALLRYLLGPAGAPGRGQQATAADRRWLAEAVDLSRYCPPSRSAYSVGALVVAGDGTVLATGHSREGSPADHAEEAALAKLGAADPRLATATLYSSLEPCRSRASRPRPCAELVIEAGLRRVVMAWREPPLLAPGRGAELLAGAGVTVVEVPDLAGPAQAVNAALLGAAASG
jgi:riboflavin-specific deaminase-like protein